MESKIEIAKAIIAVMKEVKGMEKNSRVGTGSNSYDGTKDQDVKEVFNKALSDNRLCMLQIGIEESTQIDRWEQPYNGVPQQKQSVFTKVKVKYLLLHESGESIELMGYGHGVDPQDKGAGKATTYAMKNCLLYSFCTPVGKMDDTETTHSESIPVPVKTSTNVSEDTREWFNLFDKKGNKLLAFTNLERAIEEGNTYTLKSIREKYKVSKQTEAELLEHFNIS
jgi:hypothetical protein